MIRACIFDLDGVIVDTAHYHYLAWKRLAGDLGIELSLQDNEKLKGVSRMESLEIILQLGGVEISDEKKVEYATLKNEWFVEYVEEMKPEEIFPGVKTLIKSLREKEISVALASSSKNAKRVIHLLQLDNEFDAIVDGTMIEKTKPDPEIFLLAAQMLGVKPIECLVFEDAQAGVEAARRAGMRCVGIGKMETLSSADLVLEKTGDFHVERLETF